MQVTRIVNVPPRDEEFFRQELTLRLRAFFQENSQKETMSSSRFLSLKQTIKEGNLQLFKRTIEKRSVVSSQAKELFDLLLCRNPVSNGFSSIDRITAFASSLKLEGMLFHLDSTRLHLLLLNRHWTEVELLIDTIAEKIPIECLSFMDKILDSLFDKHARLDEVTTARIFFRLLYTKQIVFSSMKWEEISAFQQKLGDLIRKREESPESFSPCFGDDLLALLVEFRSFVCETHFQLT